MYVYLKGLSPLKAKYDAYTVKGIHHAQKHPPDLVGMVQNFDAVTIGV
jgi:hypothetical protein